MGELQANVEFSVELYKFYNVDLFQRGYYQIRTSLRTSPRLASKIEICLPPSGVSEKAMLSSPQLIFPPCITNGSAVSKTFQILYRNEEVALNDVILFKAQVVVDGKRVEENLAKADFQLTIELWFTEQPFGPDHHSSIVCVSSRQLKLHLSPTAGLHHHLPVLFDYFHLSAVGVTVHGFLLAVHQPYVNTLRQAKPTWLTNSPKVGNHVQNSASLESVLFGNAVLKPSPSLTRLNQARSDHRTVCTLLLSSYESLQAKLLEYMKLLPPWQQIKIEVTNCYSKLGKLKEIAQGRCDAHDNVCKPQVFRPSYAHVDVRALDVEDELLAIVNSDIAQLCAENIILWQQFLEAFTLKDRIQQHLAREHHLQRVKRFAEGFFVVENSRYSIFHCAEQMYQSYMSISDSIRKTKYFSMLPSLGVECLEMDGSPETLPVIFEDHYQDLSRRKSSFDNSAKNKSRNSALSTTDVHLCLEGDNLAELHRKTVDSTTSTTGRTRDCGKKSKTVGCFSTGTAPKSSSCEDDACYGGSKSNPATLQLYHAGGNSTTRDGVVGCCELSVLDKVTSITTRPKSFISADELARIKEDFKISVLESKIYKTVPDMASDRQSTQSQRQEMFRSQTSKSLSAVEEAASRFVRSQSAHGAMIPRLDTVPLFSPLRQLDGRRPPCLDDFRMHKLNSNAIATYFEIREFKAIIPCNVPAIREKEPSNIGNNNRSTDCCSGSSAIACLPPTHPRPAPRSNNQIEPPPTWEPAPQAANNAGSQKRAAPISQTVEIRRVPATTEEETDVVADAAAPQDATALQDDVVAIASVPITGRPRDNLRLDLKSLNRMYDQANASADRKKAGTKSRRRLNGLQCLRLLKAQSPTCSTSSDSIILMSYKKLEQSESLPIGLSCVGHRNAVATTASASNRAGESEKGCDGTAARADDGTTRRPSVRRSASMPEVSISPSVADVDSAIATDEDDRRRSLAASESMPDLGGVSESTTLDGFPASGGNKANGVAAHGPWSSSESLAAVVMAPNASSEEMDSEDADSDDDDKKAESQVATGGSLANGTATKAKVDGDLPPATPEPRNLPSIAAITTSSVVPAPEPPKQDNSFEPNLNTTGTGLPVAAAVVPPPTVTRRCRRPSSSPCHSDSSSCSSSSSSSSGGGSSSTSEHSGWVSSPRSSSDTSSTAGERRHRPQAASTSNSAVARPPPFSTKEQERHIYEEIHLPPEEFRDPPPLPAKRTSFPPRLNPQQPPQLQPSINCCPLAVVPVPAPRLQRDSNRTPTAPSRKQQQTGVPSGNHHRRGPNEDRAKHRRAESSSSHDTGYKSERPTGKDAGLPGIHHGHHRNRQRYRSSAAARPAPATIRDGGGAVLAPEPPPRGRAKVRRREPDLLSATAGATYVDTDLAFPGRISSRAAAAITNGVVVCSTVVEGRRQNWTEVEDYASGEYSNGVEDELAKVPAPPPPASRRAGSGKEDSPSTATECEGDTGSGGWLVSVVSHHTVKFVKAKEEFKRHLSIPACLYSDCPTLASTIPYFHVSEDYRFSSVEGLHLVICVHGLDGNSADLRLVRTYLELGLPCSNLEFLMSERNQGDTFSDFEKMTDKLVAEILYHIEVYRLSPSKISFIGHSLGNIIIRSALARPQMKPLLKWLHTFLSLSGPHLGTMYNSSGLVNMGLWFMQKWKKSGSLLQLSMKDASDIRHTFLYKLSQKPGLEYFRNILLFGSFQDRYVPIHSARIELCKAAMKDNSSQGAAYRDMLHGILQPVAHNPNINLVRYDVHHALPNTANSLIGRAAHIAVLDSELFIEKFLTVCGLKYFK